MLRHLADNMWRAGISDKDTICQPEMEVFMTVTVFDSPHERSIRLCVGACVYVCMCFLVADNENVGSVLLKTTQMNREAAAFAV